MSAPADPASPPGAEPPPSGEKRSGRRRVLHNAGRLLLLFGFVALVVWVNEAAVDSARIRSAAEDFGYLGLFGVAALSGFNLVVPVPVVAFYPFFIDSGLQPVPTVATIALGMTTGDMIGYLLGRVGRHTVSPPAVVRRLIERTERLRERHRLLPYSILLLYAALVPLPNELLVIPMAYMGFRLAGIFGAALLGNVVFNALVASGLERIFDLF